MTSTWAALTDPHRRALLELLLEHPRTVGDLVERLQLSQPSTSKHLRVLRETGLVSVRRDAQRRVYALEPQPIAELDAWLAPYRRLWTQSLDERVLATGSAEAPTTRPTTGAGSTNATSTRECPSGAAVPAQD